MVNFDSMYVNRTYSPLTRTRQRFHIENQRVLFVWLNSSKSLLVYGWLYYWKQYFSYIFLPIEHCEWPRTDGRPTGIHAADTPYRRGGRIMNVPTVVFINPTRCSVMYHGCSWDHCLISVSHVQPVAEWETARRAMRKRSITGKGDIRCAFFKRSKKWIYKT